MASSNSDSYVPYTLGLDIGMASVGAACLAEDHILGLHVRAFNKAEEDKNGDPLNLTRRLARGTRRRLRRRAFRLLRLVRLFKRVGMLDQADPSEFALAQEVSTWTLRAEGLDRLLTAQEWASVLYHIVKHRGFQSNRKSEAKADEKAGQMLSGVSANQQRMTEKGYRSIGEMVAKDEHFEHSKRNKGGDYSHTFARDDLANELHLLFANQRQFASQFAGQEIEEKVHELLMARKPTLSGADLLKMIGYCTFEPHEFRAPKASHSAERFVWYTKLNNLRIVEAGESKPLSEEQRAMLIELPFEQASLKYSQVRKKLKLADTAKFNGLSYRPDDKKDPESVILFEAKAFHKLRKAYEDAGLSDVWQNDKSNHARLDELAYAQTVYKDDREARAYLQGKGIDESVISAVLTVSFTEFIRLSAKALGKILPFMAQGQCYDEAVLEAGYTHHSQTQVKEKSRYIPKISKEEITNPVVYRALNQARKLVNAIVQEYGAPMSVHIELARDLNKPFDERKRIEREQKTFRDNKEKSVKEFIAQFGREPKKDELAKYMLYREQNAQCAYSLKPLDINRLFEVGYAEIDHALPYSRSFDDGMNNKVLVTTAENRNKGNRTPFEYLGGEQNSPQWQAFVAWVESNPKYRSAKKQRLLRKHFGEEESKQFRERNLSDTRYASRKFKELVEKHLALHPDSQEKSCVVVSGQLTSLLRARWGLLKVRADGDLHHALDAAVVAGASRSMVKRMADYARIKELAYVRSGFVDPETGEIPDIDAHQAMKLHFPEPYPHFRQELLARLSPNPEAQFDFGEQPPSPVRVSRAPLRRGTGSAHQETIRSAKRLDQQESTVKTPLTSLKLKDLPNIVGYDDPRDKAWIEELAFRMKPFELEDSKKNSCAGAKAFGNDQPPLFKPSKEGKIAPQIKSVKLIDTQKSGLLLPKNHGVVNNGDMLRVDIFTKGGKFFAVPLYVADVVKKVLPNKASVAGKSEADWVEMDDSYQFLFSLQPNDWVKVSFKKDAPKEGYYAGFDRATSAISVWAHDRSHLVGDKGLMRSIGIKTALKVEKYHVDMLGNLYPVRHEVRQPLRVPKR